MNFEWDENKRQANLEKHGADFVAACLLGDDLMLIVEDLRADYSESRWIGMGKVKAQR